MTNRRTDTMKAAATYRKAAKHLRHWLTPTLSKDYPKRSMDDDLCQAASLLEAAAQMVEALNKRR